jgi:hypothetical protein
MMNNMKKLILFTAITFTFASCEDIKTASTQTVNPKKNEVNYDYGNGVAQYDVIYEVEYKGHTYGYTYVHGDMSYFHAGHCKCNQAK